MSPTATPIAPSTTSAKRHLPSVRTPERLTSEAGSAFQDQGGYTPLPIRMGVVNHAILGGRQGKVNSSTREVYRSHTASKTYLTDEHHTGNLIIPVRWNLMVFQIGELR